MAAVVGNMAADVAEKSRYNQNKMAARWKMATRIKMDDRSKMDAKNKMATRRVMDA